MTTTRRQTSPGRKEFPSLSRSITIATSGKAQGTYFFAAKSLAAIAVPALAESAQKGRFPLGNGEARPQATQLIFHFGFRGDVGYNLAALPLDRARARNLDAAHLPKAPTLPKRLIFHGVLA